jgi:hypothetical protein
MEEGSARLFLHLRGGHKVREARRFDKMAKRKKRIASVNSWPKAGSSQSFSQFVCVDFEMR